MAQNLYSQIDWNQPDAKQELDRRQQMSNQVQAMNQMLQSNPNNKALQNTLISQYMDMVMPQQKNPQDEIGMAMDFLASGDEGLAAIGKQMIAKSPLLKDYGMDAGSQAITNPLEAAKQAQTATSFNSLFGTSDMQPNDPNYSRNFNVQQQAVAKPQLMDQYYAQKDPNWFMSGGIFDPRFSQDYKLKQAGFNL